MQVSKDIDSGITHYVCIHVASEVTTKAARELDPTSPVALPKLPNGMAETPTARSAPLSHHQSCISTAVNAVVSIVSSVVISVCSHHQYL